MKKLLLALGLFLFASDAHAKCLLFDYSKCPADIQCPTGTLMSDDGECIDCQSDKEVNITCMGLEKANKACPNRFYTYACGTYSHLKCPTGTSNHCDDIKISGIQRECWQKHDNKCYAILSEDTF